MYASMKWYFIKHRDNFTITYLFHVYTWGIGIIFLDSQDFLDKNLFVLSLQFI